MLFSRAFEMRPSWLVSALAPLIAGTLAGLAGPAKAAELNPGLVGSYGTGEIRSVTVSGTNAFIVGGFVMQILDIRDPSSPTLLATYTAPRPTHDVVVSNNVAYLAAEGAGLIILDVINPTMPALLGVYDTAESAYGVFLSGNHVYIADGQAGLVVVDVTDPRKPLRAGGLQLPGEVHQVVVSGSYAYLADRFWSGPTTQEIGALRVVDISNLAEMTLVANHETIGQAWDIAAGVDKVYVGSSALEVFDVGDPMNPRKIGSYSSGGNVELSGDRAFVASGNTGVHILNITDPATPRRIGGYQTGGYARNVTVTGRHGYVATSTGLRIIDTGIAASLQTVGHLALPGNTRGVAVSDKRAYAVNLDGEMTVLDITVPTKPTVVGNYSTGQPAGSEPEAYVAASGNYAYLGQTGYVYGGGGPHSLLHVVDVDNPLSPQLIGSYHTTRGQLSSLVVSGNYAYLGLSDYPSGVVEIIDLNHPESPNRVATYGALAGVPTDITARGSHLFIWDGNKGLLVLDVSNPTAPQVLGRYTGPAGGGRIAATDKYAYCQSWLGGLVGLDVSDPSYPTKLGSTTGFGSTSTVWKGMEAAGSYIYAATGGSGVQVLDVSVPADIQHVGGNSGPYANDLVISGGYIFVAGGPDGLKVFDPVSRVPQPSLKITRSGGSVVISWPADIADAVLETADHLGSASAWSPVSVMPIVNGNQKLASLDMGVGPRFFRLRVP